MSLTKLKVALLVLTLGATAAGVVSHQVLGAGQSNRESGTARRPETTGTLGHGILTVPQRTIRTPVHVPGNVSYARLFERALAVVEELFGGVAYANRYEGRIESDLSAVSAGKGLRPDRRRRAVLSITCPETSGYKVEVKVFRERRVRGTEPGTAEIAWQADGRDRKLEQVILRRLVRMKKNSDRP
jgi:hypothetical protein